MKLLKVIYITRHGNRGPLTPLKNSPWKEGFGLLTDKGRNALYLKGNQYATSKKEFFQTLKWPEDVFVISSNVERTMDTAYCLLKAFQNKSKDENSIKQKIEYLQTFGYTVGSIINDLIFKGYAEGFIRGLKPYYDELNRVHKEKQIYAKKFNTCKEALQKAHGLDIDKMEYIEIFNTVDHLNCVRSNDMEFLCAEDYMIVKELAFMHYYLLYDLMYADEHVRKFTNHFFFKALIHNLTKQEKRLYFYSSHDANILSSLIAMGYIPKDVPCYCADLVIYLYESESDKFVDVTYQGVSIFSKPKLLSEFIKMLTQNMFDSDEQFFKESLIDGIKEKYSAAKTDLI